MIQEAIKFLHLYPYIIFATMIAGCGGGGGTPEDTGTSVYNLTVSLTGSGTVTSTPANINCGASCSSDFPQGTKITLIAVADNGSVFTSWTGPCLSNGNSCTVDMTAVRNITANFSPITPKFKLDVNVTGSGTVSSNPAGINCGMDCSAQYGGDSVSLTAQAGNGFQFSGWNGDCMGTGICVVQMNQVRNVSASFSPQVSQNCQDTTVHCVDDTAGPTQEFSTIQAAVDVAQGGHTVLVHDGNYASGFRVSQSGTSPNRLVIKALGTSVIITGPEASSNESIYIDNASYVTIEGFIVDRAGRSGYGIGAHGATPNNPMRGLTIRNNTVHDSGSTNIYLSQVADSLVEGNTAYGSQSSHGIYLTNGGSDNTTLRANHCYNNNVNGIHFNGDLSVGSQTDGLHTGLVIENNIIHDNVANGLDMDGVQSSQIRNNLIYANGRHALRAFAIDSAAGPANLNIVNNTFLVPGNGSYPIKLTEDGGGHVIFNNILIHQNNGGSISIENNNLVTANNLVADLFELGGTNRTLAAWQTLGYGTGSALAPPETTLFVDPGNAGYQPKDTSAIDSGRASLQSVSAPDADIDGNIRPSGNGFDIGAYETTSSSGTGGGNSVGGTSNNIPTGANQYYIAPQGRDDSNCTATVPCKTFQKAVSMLNANDELIIKDGYYTLIQNGTLDPFEGNGNPIALSAMPPSGIDQQNPTVIRAENPGQVQYRG